MWIKYQPTGRLHYIIFQKKTGLAFQNLFPTSQQTLLLVYKDLPVNIVQENNRFILLIVSNVCFAKIYPVWNADFFYSRWYVQVLFRRVNYKRSVSTPHPPSLTPIRQSLAFNFLQDKFTAVLHSVLFPIDRWALLQSPLWILHTESFGKRTRSRNRKQIQVMLCTRKRKIFKHIKLHFYMEF